MTVQRPGAWIDLGLTLPIFVAYHLGVVFLNVHNASDLLTFQLLRVAEGNTAVYLLLCAAIGVVFAGVFAWLGRGQAFRPRKFVQILLEGAAYAFVLRVGGAYIVGRLFAATSGGGAAGAVPLASQGPFAGIVMSLGAGFYEELTFRVVLFGLGAKLMTWLFAGEPLGFLGKSEGRPSLRAIVIAALWAVIAAAAFSGVHYIGELGDPFKLTSFVFRLVLGLLLTLIYVTRGFAAAVWAHALYDVWVLVL